MDELDLDPVLSWTGIPL